MVVLTTASHWSIVRTRADYVSDVVVGDVVGTLVALGLRAGCQPGRVAVRNAEISCPDERHSKRRCRLAGSAMAAS